MSRHISLLALLLLAFAPVIASAQTPAAPPAQPTLWRFVHPNANAVISIDWSRVRKSHIGSMLREKWVDGAAVPGSEFLDDADHFIVSSPGRNPDTPDAEAPMLIVVGGHFDLAKVRSVLIQHGAKPQKFNSWQLYRPQGKDAKDLAFVLLDSQTILIGDSRSIFASLERSANLAATPEPNSLLARAADMESKYDTWAIMSGNNSLGGDRLTALLTDQDGESASTGFEVGFSLRNGLAADIALAFDNETAAKRAANELSKMMKLAVKDKLGEPALLDLEKRLKFTALGTFARLSLRLTPQELEKNAQIFAATHRQPAANVADIRPVMKPEPQPPPTPEKMVIRIEGLDSGTREIPYNKQQ